MASTTTRLSYLGSERRRFTTDYFASSRSAFRYFFAALAATRGNQIRAADLLGLNRNTLRKKIRDLDDIIWAHMEGTVLRVRPKLMTVSTMLIGLVPLLWATGSGADVMKRIAAPMVGGLLTSAFLTLEVIPVIYTYWRYSQLQRHKRTGRPLAEICGMSPAHGEEITSEPSR